ncbi:MAG: NAD-dependent ligase LigA, partial [Bacteroidota bacterium]
MYSTGEIKDLQEKSKLFISKAQDEEFLVQNIKVLRELIQFHEQRYYVMNDPLVADFEFD